MSSVRIKLICRQILLKLTGKGLNLEKLDKLTTSKRLNFTRSDTKAIIAGLEFILGNAAKHDVNQNTLQEELMQLGLPQDTCVAICKGYGEKKDEMRDYFKKESLKLPQLKNCEWRVDYLISSSEVKSLRKPSVRLNLHLGTSEEDQDDEEMAFEVTPEKFRVLINELKIARDLMKDL
mmetsp:Transcript_4/g.10  ORF Transcript_4/g.10 Transcript_4/m.10 type:complete len:178 (-) Transcript_4:101-634(-)|eukprot:CAMPEP_0185274174 /NCGR_PEP_ID=MMETSP1359-20130426/51256_1 /TAXON_ID=552665 /ORGANISM="Bigelowiella longifila, Strain CCMP242" /LENGTH=177 /DNA_ID=CAMNT_0027867057 /DNA_START=157 /DNA_END=690 /DNA_ORIENTATION=-